MTAPFDRRHHQNRALTRRGHPHMTDVTFAVAGPERLESASAFARFLLNWLVLTTASQSLYLGVRLMVHEIASTLLLVPKTDYPVFQTHISSIPHAVVCGTEARALSSTGGRSVALQEVALATLALVTCSPAGQAEGSAFVRQLEEVRGAAPEIRVIDLSDVAESEVAARLKADLLTVLIEAAAIGAARAVSLMRDTVQLRGLHQSTQAAFSKLERYVLQSGLAQRVQGAELALAVSDRGVSLTQDTRIEQRLPGSSVGLSDVAIAIARVPGESDGVLTVRLRTHEDDAAVAWWRFPAEDLQRGWLRLSLPVSLDDDARTARLSLEWTGAAPLEIGRSGRHPDPRFQAQGAGDASEHAIALRLWTYVPGCQAPIVSEGRYPGESRGPMSTAPAAAKLPEPLRTGSDMASAGQNSWELSSDILGRAENLNPGNRDFKYLVELAALQVHALPNGVAAGLLRDTIPAGVRGLRVKVATLAPEGPPIDYAIAVGPAPKRSILGKRPIPHPDAFSSDWHRFEATEKGEVALFLEEPLDETVSLYLMTRLSRDDGNAGWAWSTFLTIQLLV